MTRLLLAAPALFEDLFDDAALFPPGDAPMTEAVPAHRALRAQLGGLVGPLVVPAGRLDELTDHLDVGPPVEVAVIATPGELPATLARIAADPGLALGGVEVPVVADTGSAARAVAALDEVLPAGLTAAVEVPRTAARDEVLDVLAGTRYRAKLRTGGLRAELFPSPTELAATLHACIRRRVPFKCTAGLHHAASGVDPSTGFFQHGFLNLMVATSALAAGAAPAVAAERLADTDAGALVTALRTWPGERVAGVRALFTSFGTCSVLEPVDDLVRLGLLSTSVRELA